MVMSQLSQAGIKRERTASHHCPSMMGASQIQTSAELPSSTDGAHRNTDQLKVSSPTCEVRWPDVKP